MRRRDFLRIASAASIALAIGPTIVDKLSDFAFSNPVEDYHSFTGSLSYDKFNSILEQVFSYSASSEKFIICSEETAEELKAIASKKINK